MVNKSATYYSHKPVKKGSAQYFNITQNTITYRTIATFLFDRNLMSNAKEGIRKKNLNIFQKINDVNKIKIKIKIGINKTPITGISSGNTLKNFLEINGKTILGKIQ